MAYSVLTQDDLTKWWITGTGSVVNRLSEVMDDNPNGPYIFYSSDSNIWTLDVPPFDNEYYFSPSTEPDYIAENLSGWNTVAKISDDQRGNLNLDEWTWINATNRVQIRMSDDSNPNDVDIRAHYKFNGMGAGPAFMYEDVEDGLYEIYIDFEIGDGSTATTLTLLDELVWFDDSITYAVLNNATFTGERSCISIYPLGESRYLRTLGDALLDDEGNIYIRLSSKLITAV